MVAPLTKGPDYFQISVKHLTYPRFKGRHPRPKSSNGEGSVACKKKHLCDKIEAALIVATTTQMKLGITWYLERDVGIKDHDYDRMLNASHVATRHTYYQFISGRDELEELSKTRPGKKDKTSIPK